jgi:hypothetical protein
MLKLSLGVLYDSFIPGDGAVDGSNEKFTEDGTFNQKYNDYISIRMLALYDVVRPFQTPP